ncbi:MAG: hypothetical protein JXX28_14205 [Deltaproteobacteria bacterium]|nr:hypothetical protein [Deltaproteobacteria bacterium]
MRSSSALLALSASLLAGCTAGGDAYSPSLTMLRKGEVVVEEPPPIPEALWIPGVNVQSEDYEIEESSLPIGMDLSAMRDLEDPAPLNEHAAYDYSSGRGALLDALEAEGAISFDDVEQGAIGDCFFVAALSAAVYSDGDGILRDGMIRDVKDANGLTTHFVVRFYDAWGNPQDIEVDGDLVRKGSKVTYARSTDTRVNNEEWWVSLVEKAYSQWHGGYSTIGEGGWAGDVMQALSGSTANYRKIKYLNDTTMYATIRSAVDGHRPVVAGTFGEDDGVDYTGKHIYAFHAYSVLDTRKDDQGGYFVTLRNPWAEVEPPGNGVDDGIFELPFKEFRELYQGLTFGGGYTADHTAPAEVKDLQIDAIGPDSITLGFTAPGDDGDDGLAAKYDLRVCDHAFTADDFYACDAVAVGGPQSPGSHEAVLVSGLEEGKTYWFAIRTEDESRNLAEVSSTISATVQSAVDDEPALPWERFVDFEDGDAGWVGTGLFHLAVTEASSGTHAWWFGIDDTLNYDNGGRVSGTLTSPKYDLDGVAAPALLWEQILDVESGAGTDRAWLEVSTEGGDFADWTAVWEKESTSSSYDMGYASLDGYGGQVIRLRFRFDSMDANNNGGLGWLIDDVMATEE